ncbi:single-stranded DNA-binding protein [Lelliottia wanjuensis]|uniref:single-stranded DNA-binding protein n=1 Tax=Lelliottia wanjuensis TaxID=3050585 RepID=UPI0025517070|nr:single-stranded DNA-binding protein [Lelliottia sp. V86_10]MDK9583177.1 single-stranded DNA-binding protein [Lelliottia sp. V86_10]
MTAQMAAHGRIVADVQTKPTSSGSNMAFTRIAVALPCRAAENAESTMWLGVTAFGKQAEALARHQKGDLICVSGLLQVNQWTGPDGGIQSGYALVADSVISAKTVKPGGGAGKHAGNGQSRRQQAHQQHPPEDYDQSQGGGIPF